jgi:hypothetical protein
MEDLWAIWQIIIANKVFWTFSETRNLKGSITNPKGETMPRTVARKPATVKFVQIISQPWEGDEGTIQSSLVALGNDGGVYKYYHSEKAWVPLSSDILRRA